MNNKGFAVDHIGKLLIGLVTLVIIITVFFIGPSALYEKVQNAMPNLRDYIGIRGGSQSAITDIERREAQGAFVRIVHDVETIIANENAGTHKDCFYVVPYQTMNNLMQTYQMQYEPEDNSLVARIEPQTQSSEQIAPGYYRSIPNARFCLVANLDAADASDRFAAQYFYDRYLQEHSNPDDSKFSYLHASAYYSNPKIAYTVTKNTIYPLEEAGGERITFFNYRTKNEGDYVIYIDFRGQEQHCITFIPVETARVFSIGSDDCRLNRGKLDDDCFEKDAVDSLYEQESFKNNMCSLDPADNVEQTQEGETQ